MLPNLSIGRRTQKAFTLIEVLLAIGIATGILMVVLYFYQQSEGLRTRLLQETTRISAARLIMERLTLELAAARRSEFYQQGLIGGPDSLQFVKVDFPLALTWTNQPGATSAPPATLFRLVSYSLSQDTNDSGAGVIRSEQPLSRRTAPLSTNLVSTSFLSTSLVSSNLTSTNAEDALLAGNRPASTGGVATGQLQYLHFRYWDGKTWLDSWTTPDLPVGVEVSLGVDPLPVELSSEDYPFEVYRRVIYLPNHSAAPAFAADSAMGEAP